jgi:CheY-like chemotaxis protein
VSSPRSPHPARPMNATIVVVDDDPTTLTLVERTLRGEGYRVWTATRAAEARKVLTELAGAVDLVLTDIAMPGGLGSELAAEIRSSQGWASRFWRLSCCESRSCRSTSWTASATHFLFSRAGMERCDSSSWKTRR